MQKRIGEIKRINISEHDHYANGIMVEQVHLTESFKFHWHNYYEIEYVTGGVATEVFNGERYPLFPGVMHVITPSDFHELIVDRPLSMIKICFNLSDVSAETLTALPTEARARRLVLKGDGKELFDHLFLSAQLQSALLRNAPDYPRVIGDLVESLLLCATEYLRKQCIQAPDESSKRSQDISAALAYVHANLANRITLTEVAELLHFSPAHLSRSFHQSVGMPFTQYVKRLRLELASKLLINTDTSITDVSFEVGYSSPSDFSNEFKKRYGASPTAYRRAHRGKTTAQQ